MALMEDKLKRLKVYWKIWKTSTILSFESVLENRLGVIFFSLGKLIRFIFFILFLMAIHLQVEKISGIPLIR